MNLAYHHPPELIEQLVEVIPLLNRSKAAVIEFFRGAGVEEGLLADLRVQVSRDRQSIGKHAIARTVLARINQDQSDNALRARREIVKRIVEFEDFSLCWPDDQLKAKGLVASVRDTVQHRDYFTRMANELEKDRRARQREQADKLAASQRRADDLRAIHDELCALFADTNPWRRGKSLEGVLNRWCALAGIGVREAFTIRGNQSEGIVEQIDGVIALRNRFFLVEMKWHSEPLGMGVVGLHLSRLFLRADVGGLLISASRFTEPAIATARDALTKVVYMLCDLEELVRLSARGGDLAALLGSKLEAATLDRDPFRMILE